MSNTDCPRIYFRIPKDHGLHEAVIEFQAGRQAVHDTWMAFKDIHGASGIYANNRMHGLTFDEGQPIPEGWYNPVSYDDGAYVPHAGRTASKQAHAQLLALADMPGGADLSEVMYDFLNMDEDKSYMGGFPGNANRGGSGFMVYYMGYEIYGDEYVLSVPDLDTAPKEIEGLAPLKKSEYYAIRESAEEAETAK